MNGELVRRYNTTVANRDTVLWLGDCFFGLIAAAQSVLSEMNGRKLLVLGNHDRSASAMARLGFTVVTDPVMHIGGHRCRGSHRPYADGAKDGPARRQGEVLLHGHTHDTRVRNGNMINLCVEAWNYFPVQWSTVALVVHEVYDV